MGKSTKNASKPKSKMSAYQCFMVAMKDERKAKNPGESMKLAELSKDVSGKWRNISDKDKKKYEEMAAKDTKRFKEEMSTYVPTEVVSRKRKRAQKDPNAPKRALSSFFFFCNEERPKVKAETPGLTIGDVAKEMGRRWEACKNKAKYEELNRKDKERYEKEKESYVPAEVAPPSKITTKSKPAPKGRKKAKIEKEDEDEDEDERENEEEEENNDEDEDGDSD